MSSLFDLYLRDNIMDTCEAYFNDYLRDEGVSNEKLNEDDRVVVGYQIDILIDMIERIYKEYDDEFESYGEMIDKLIGFCIVGKMNEARLCRLLNEAEDKKDD